MKLARNAIPLACVACAAALFACNKNDRTGQTTTRSAADQDRNATMSAPSGTSTAGSQGGGGMHGGPYGVGSSSDRTSLDMGGTTTTQSGSMGGSGTTGSGTTGTTSGTMTGDTSASGTMGGGIQTTALRYETATARIVSAHCDREMACNQIGPNKRFASRDVCSREQGQKIMDEVKQSDCSNDIDANKLQACLTSVAQQDCSRLNQSLKNVDSCKATTLCR